MLSAMYNYTGPQVLCENLSFIPPFGSIVNLGRCALPPKKLNYAVCFLHASPSFSVILTTYYIDT